MVRSRLAEMLKIDNVLLGRLLLLITGKLIILRVIVSFVIIFIQILLLLLELLNIIVHYLQLNLIDYRNHFIQIINFNSQILYFFEIQILSRTKIVIIIIVVVRCWGGIELGHILGGKLSFFVDLFLLFFSVY